MQISGGMDESLFAELTASEDGHFWFEPRNRVLASLAARFFPNAKTYMEIGCGTGFVLRRFLQMRRWDRVVGTDLFESGLLFAKERLPNGVEFMALDARKIGMPHTFDLIGAYDVIEHIPEDEDVLREMYSAIVPGGGAIIAVPQHPFLWSSFDEVSHHQRRYARGELERKALAAGFRVEWSNSYNAVLMPLMLVKRTV